MRLIKYTVFAAFIMAFSLAATAVNLADETLNYKVLYKWGLVNKTAGRATVTLRGNATHYKAVLVGRSESWADNFYKLRDTLISTMTRDNLYPVRYDKIAHENGRFSHDIVKFTRSGNTFTGNCTRHRRGKNDASTTTQTTLLKAEGMTVDMLSVFYYIRTLDFLRMKNGDTKVINIFSGKKKEKLTITFHGNKVVDINGKNRTSHYITFKFTTDGKKSSDPIKAWISADGKRIPLKLEGNLKVCKIQCIYTGS